MSRRAWNLCLIWLAVLLFGGWLVAQEHDVTLDYAPTIDNTDRVWGDVPYCPNKTDMGLESTDLGLWQDGCTLRWNKAQSCFECL